MTSPLPPADVPANRPVYDQRGWTMEDMETAIKDLPDPDDAGPAFKHALLDFCSVFLPFGFELRRLLMMKVGLKKYMKIKKAIAALGDSIGPKHPDWDHGTNFAYRKAMTTLSDEIAKAFPANIDRIIYCKQQPNERFSDFYQRFEAVVSLHSGIDKPDDLGSNMGPWEGVLKTFLMKGLRADIRDKIKESCIGAEGSARLLNVLGHAYHHDDALASAAVEAERKAKETKREAEISLMNAVTDQLRAQSLGYAPRGRGQFGRGRGRGRSHGSGRYRSVQTVNCIDWEEAAHDEAD